MIWFRIIAPHFVAAGEVNKFGKVSHTAPIIAYMLRNKWGLNDVKNYCKKKQWEIEVYGI